MSGRLIADRYRLDERIGAGGMGVVWRATDLELRRVVALKRSQSGDSGQIRREARLGAGLHHPHVVTVFDAVMHEDDRWLVMEYLPSRSLATILDTDGPLPPADVARIGLQLAGALAAMHAKGMVHRDVKPGNVLLTGDGTAKLTDLGIAVWADQTVTDSGRFGGTPGYLAPEVVTGIDAGAAADVFSLGATLFAAVEGESPWGDSAGTPIKQLRRAAAFELEPIRRADMLSSTLVELLRESPAERPSARQTVALLAKITGAELPPQEIRAPAPVLKSSGPPLPRQLPAAPGAFTGREAELKALTRAVAAGSGAVVISALVGTGGIGKTWLALHWAYQNLDRFPDGQLFIDLLGFSPQGQPLAAEIVVRGFLEAFGVDPARVPVYPNAQAALLRSLIADKRMLILLDNAADTAQVIPLLPGGSACTVLVTSRRDELTGLIVRHGAHHLPIGALDEQESRELLTARLGAGRVAAEPDAIDELVARCGGFPLALSIVAGRARTHPDLPLATLATELREAGLAMLDGDDPAASLPAVLSWSRRTLSPRHAEVFGLLGGAPGPDISLQAAARLAGLTTAETRAALESLQRASLLHQSIAGRYRMHDLVRLYAADHDDPGRPDALTRLIHYYRDTAAEAAGMAYPHEKRLPRHDTGTFADPEQALTWLDTERHNLVATTIYAATRGWQREAIQLTSALSRYLNTCAHHNGLGEACHAAGRLDEATTHFEAALQLAVDTGVRNEQARAREGLGSLSNALGRNESARTHWRDALNLYEELGVPAAASLRAKLSAL